MEGPDNRITIRTDALQPHFVPVLVRLRQPELPETVKDEHGLVDEVGEEFLRVLRDVGGGVRYVVTFHPDADIVFENVAM